MQLSDHLSARSGLPTVLQLLTAQLQSHSPCPTPGTASQGTRDTEQGTAGTMGQGWLWRQGWKASTQQAKWLWMGAGDTVEGSKEEPS